MLYVFFYPQFSFFELNKFFLIHYFLTPVNSLALRMTCVLLNRPPAPLLGLDAQLADAKYILVLSKSRPLAITFPLRPLRTFIIIAETFTGYLPDIIFPFLWGISPLKGIGLLNIRTSSRSSIALSIFLPFMKEQIYIQCFFEALKLTPRAMASSFFFFSSFFISFLSLFSTICLLSVCISFLTSSLFPACLTSSFFSILSSSF